MHYLQCNQLKACNEISKHIGMKFTKITTKTNKQKRKIKDKDKESKSDLHGLPPK